jgi:glycosyltransferase involved in cell wall biosynthesis
VVEWANVKKIPLIYEEHQTLDEQFGLWREFRRSVNQATAVVAVSEKSAEALRTVGKTTQPIVVMTPSVVDPIASGWLDSIDVRYRPGPLVATTIARLSEAKGLTYLLEAIAQLRSTYPQVSFHVRGDGAMREELLAQANRLGLNGDEIFVGPFVREQLPRIMEQTDIFVMSSISEGQPLAIVEAMAFGRPIVTTAVGGIPEMIQHGRNGLLCEACNPTDLVDKISQLLENPRLRMELGRAARRSFEEGPFEPVYVCRKFISLYGQTIAMATNPKPASLVSERITY